MMPVSATRSLEMMIGGLLQATQDTQRDITEIRRDVKESDARASNRSSAQPPAARRCIRRPTNWSTATETAVSKLNDDMNG
ncbi:hypothetical protein P9272_33625 [Mesorhizobium sp. WSM4976]|uniref:hypothetical protein n=1 Tax=Mesorhizobium sp. WSM4976 TaxID=3038549 RepID=UPI0024162768|nr:hypothetical protein [Mesorhizobium sp. WSM4976]MDG4898469.1 hypothetical protein [Mesorhizobium sp. WSM4976]